MIIQNNLFCLSKKIFLITGLSLLVASSLHAEGFTNYLTLNQNALVLSVAGTSAAALGAYGLYALTQQKSLSENIDSINGTLADFACVAPFTFPSLFSKAPESILFSLSQLKAKKVFWHAYNTVPAYKDYISTHCATLPQEFKDIYPMSKGNYIKKYEVGKTFVNGQFPKKGQIDTSTGTTGKPTKWVRGSTEMQHVKRWIKIASNVALGDKPYIFCNMFALGPWATGMTCSYALCENQLVLSIGPNLEMMYDVLKDFGPNHKYVIAGYPPHMKKLVDNAPFALHAYDITVVVGGEAMSETVYESIIKGGIKEVYSSYGASDLRINIAQQTDFERKLQQLCHTNSQFKHDLLGTCEGTPTLFHYNPLLDYIEETEDGSLLFTDLDIDRVSPRVRYDLGDKGKIIKMSKVTNLLAVYGIDLTPRTNLPILCLYGRGDDALTYNGCNLMYDDLERAIAKIPQLLDKVNHYAYNKFENNNLDQQLEFWIELKKDVLINDLNLDIDVLNSKLIEALSEVNQDFKAQIAFTISNKTAQLLLPTTYVYEYGTSPMVKQEGHHKNKYVYNHKR